MDSDFNTYVLLTLTAIFTFLGVNAPHITRWAISTGLTLKYWFLSLMSIFIA